MASDASVTDAQGIEQLLEYLQAPLFTTKKGEPVEVPAPLAPLADTHGHLTPLRHMNPAVAVARAALVGVRLLAVPVDPADDVPDVPAFLSWFDEVLHTATELLASNGDTPLCSEHLPNDTFFLAGVHPYGAQKFIEDPTVHVRLLELLDHDLCKGVGEFGLDYGPWNKLPADVQIAAFREHLRIAHERNLPVELHIRDADGDAHAQAHVDALRVLREEGVPAAGCDLHCYTSGPDVMTPFVELGCHVAFGGAVTFARSEDIRAAAVACPANTDILSDRTSPTRMPGTAARSIMALVRSGRRPEGSTPSRRTPPPQSTRRGPTSFCGPVSAAWTRPATDRTSPCRRGCARGRTPRGACRPASAGRTRTSRTRRPSRIADPAPRAVRPHTWRRSVVRC